MHHATIGATGAVLLTTLLTGCATLGGVERARPSDAPSSAPSLRVYLPSPSPSAASTSAPTDAPSVAPTGSPILTPALPLPSPSALPVGVRPTANDCSWGRRALVADIGADGRAWDAALTAGDAWRADYYKGWAGHWQDALGMLDAACGIPPRERWSDADPVEPAGVTPPPAWAVPGDPATAWQWSPPSLPLTEAGCSQPAQWYATARSLHLGATDPPGAEGWNGSWADAYVTLGELWARLCGTTATPG